MKSTPAIEPRKASKRIEAVPGSNGDTLAFRSSMTTELSTRNDLREVVRNMRTSELIDVIANVYAAENVVDADRAERRHLVSFASIGADREDHRLSHQAHQRLGKLVKMLRDAARDEIDRRLPREAGR